MRPWGLGARRGGEGGRVEGWKGGRVEGWKGGRDGGTGGTERNIWPSPEGSAYPGAAAVRAFLWALPLQGSSRVGSSALG